MDQFLEIVFHLMPYLHLLAAVAFILKIVMVFRSKGFDMAAVFLSLFRIYNITDLNMTSNSNRIYFMKMNNYLNYFIYAWALITLIIFIVFQRVY